MRKRFSEYLNDPEIEYWDDDHLLPKINEGATILVLGRRGSHKTGVTAQRVMDAVLKANLRALYVPCEDQQFFGKQRMPAYCADRDIDVSDLDDRFECVDHGINLSQKDVADQFIADHSDFAPDIIIIDTLRQAVPGIDMNSSTMADIIGQAGPLRKIRRAFNCIVFVLCHPPKGNGDTVSGSGGIEDNSDMILQVEFDREKNIVTETVTRHKNGPEGVQFFYAVDPTKVPVPKRIESPNAVRADKLGAVPHDPDIAFAMLIRHALAEDDIHTYSSGLTNQPMAQRLCPRGTDETEQAWLDRVKTMRKRLSNIQQKQVATERFSYFDDLTGWCENEDLADPQDRKCWKWWDHPRQSSKSSLEVDRIMENVSGASPN